LQEFRTASEPLAESDVKARVSPVMLRAERVKPMNAMNPEPEAFRQSAQ
jgi:hypothetical protein